MLLGDGAVVKVGRCQVEAREGDDDEDVDDGDCETLLEKYFLRHSRFIFFMLKCLQRKKWKLKTFACHSIKRKKIDKFVNRLKYQFARNF